MILLKFLPAVAVVVLLFGTVTILFVFRARSMRALAAKWGFKYVGPRAPSFRGFRDFRKVKPPVPLPHACDLAGEIRQAWNVIEGQQNGVRVLIFDSVIWGRTYCTFIACQREQNPFGMDSSPDRVIQSGGWTVLYRVRWLQIIPRSMSIQRLDDYVNKLRFGLV
ncbi:MAG: hypothetical protein WA424_06565 [Candidatus Sulfotelmatobacter sp.]